MDITADHTGFVIAAYAVSATTLVALAVWIIARDRAARQRLKGDLKSDD